jgi:hypothetical protein
VVWSVVVFGEDAGAILGAEDYDGVDGEQGHAGRHGCGFVWLHAGVWSICDMDAIKIANVVDSGSCCLGCEGFTRGNWMELSISDMKDKI